METCPFIEKSQKYTKHWRITNQINLSKYLQLFLWEMQSNTKAQETHKNTDSLKEIKSFIVIFEVSHPVVADISIKRNTLKSRWMRYTSTWSAPTAIASAPLQNRPEIQRVRTSARPLWERAGQHCECLLHQTGGVRYGNRWQTPTPLKNINPHSWNGYPVAW